MKFLDERDSYFTLLTKLNVVLSPWNFLKSLSHMKCLHYKQSRCLLAMTKPRQTSVTDRTYLPTKYALTGHTNSSITISDLLECLDLGLAIKCDVVRNKF